MKTKQRYKIVITYCNGHVTLLSNRKGDTSWQRPIAGKYYYQMRDWMQNWSGIGTKPISVEFVPVV